ncbi:hypothetical protein [Rhizobium hidalgonense]|uniref:hypothetical protein n=1 Tax=Rhizobium hidalgonense TaxID=1538159 RepID=UPI001105B960|nr:hypothetical protein [Rhizobium hidalgonense]QKK24699.1 hypothetical protein FFM81_015740 [Rhizobium hidalgonense]
MAVYTVSFDFAYDDTYDKRYSSFNEQVKASGVWWAETTSFIVVESPETIEAFCDRIYFQSDFNSSKDRVLVLDANVKSGRYRGVNSDGDLFKLLPFVQKV